MASDKTIEKWRNIMGENLDRSVSFEIHCWKEETEEFELAILWGREEETNWNEGRVICGNITPGFRDFILSLPRPKDREVYNKITQFFSIFLDNGFSSEHYGTELNMQKGGRVFPVEIEE